MGETTVCSDAMIAELMEPRASLPTISAHEARLQHWGPDPEKWTWYSCDDIKSPLGWWEAEIGTDHGPPAFDNKPVRWRPALEPEGEASDIAVAWRVAAKMGVRYPEFIAALNAMLLATTDFKTPIAALLSLESADAASAIVRAALSVAEPTP